MQHLYAIVARMGKREEQPLLAELGALIRAARLARKLTQQRAARAAGVSRRQWALLETGGNVSVAFLLKVAQSLELTTIPLSGTVRVLRGSGEYNAFDLLDIADGVSGLADRLRDFAITGLLPPSERVELKDAPAIRAFLERHSELSAAGVAAIDRTLREIATEAAPPLDVDRKPHEVAERTRQQRRRRK